MSNPIVIESAILKAALLFASNEETRYYLNGVRVEPTGHIVSTDGHNMFVARVDIGEGPGFEAFTIPREALKKALAGRVPEYIELTSSRVHDTTFSPIDIAYPDWRRVVPAEVPADGATAHFNPDCLALWGKACSLLSPTRKGNKKLCMPFHLYHNGNDPAGIKVLGRSDIFGVIMPVRTKESDPWSSIVSNVVGQ